MDTLLVLHWIVYHLLANRACQALLNALNEILRDHVVEEKHICRPALTVSIALEGLMIDKFAVFVALTLLFLLALFLVVLRRWDLHEVNGEAHWLSRVIEVFKCDKSRL